MPLSIFVMLSKFRIKIKNKLKITASSPQVKMHNSKIYKMSGEGFSMVGSRKVRSWFSGVVKCLFNFSRSSDTSKKLFTVGPTRSIAKGHWFSYSTLFSLCCSFHYVSILIKVGMK